jgi:rod shape-determining protein MreC
LSSRSSTAVKRRVVAGVLVLLSLVLITVYFREPAGGGLHSVQSSGATVLRPFEVAANRVASPFRDAYGWFSGLVHAKSENADLRAKLDKLRAQVTQDFTAAAENADLKRQINYIHSPDFPQDFIPVTAEVIGRSPGEFNQQVTIANRPGSGIRVDQAVVTADGLVGKVSKVAGHQAQVTLLTDPSLKVAALVLPSQAAGLVAHGEGSGTLTLDRVRKSAVVNPGDSIVTQGFKLGPLSSIYPALSEVDLFWEVQISPSVHFDSLRSVIVLVPKSRLR